MFASTSNQSFFSKRVTDVVFRALEKIFVIDKHLQMRKRNVRMKEVLWECKKHLT